MEIQLTTYKDLLDHAIDWLGANVSGDASRDARRAIQNAYRQLSTDHMWSYYYTRGRLNTAAVFLDGTIQYQTASGSFPRQLTLTTTDSGVWPAWAGLGTILVGNVTFEIARRVDDNNLQITAQSDPGVDFPAGTSYTLYQDIYPMPADFIAADELINSSYVLALEYVHPNAWLARQRLVRGPAIPYIYTFTSEPRFFGSMAVRFYPAPDQVYNIDFIYKRRPRAMLIDQSFAGTASASSGTAVSGVGTNWTSNMVGSVFRFSQNQQALPTGLVGSNPYAYERVITAVGGPTNLTLDSAVPANFTNAPYLISDPADVEQAAMLTVLERGIEYQLGMSRSMKERAALQQTYNQALILAREADQRSFQRRVAGQEAPLRMRLAYMPRGADVS